MDWERSVEERNDCNYTKSERSKMMLSKDTLSGIKMTGVYNVMYTHNVVHVYAHTYLVSFPDHLHAIGWSGNYRT